MISDPRRGQVTPIDVGFASASLSATVAAAGKIRMQLQVLGKVRRSIINVTAVSWMSTVSDGSDIRWMSTVIS